MSCELGFALVSGVFAEYSVKAQFVILGDFGVCGRVDPFVGCVSMIVIIVGCFRINSDEWKIQWLNVALSTDVALLF